MVEEAKVKKIICKNCKWWKPEFEWDFDDPKYLTKDENGNTRTTKKKWITYKTLPNYTHGYGVSELGYSYVETPTDPFLPGIDTCSIIGKLVGRCTMNVPITLPVCMANSEYNRLAQEAVGNIDNSFARDCPEEGYDATKCPYYEEWKGEGK